MSHALVNLSAMFFLATSLAACTAGSRPPNPAPMLSRGIDLDGRPLTLSDGQSVRVGGDAEARVQSHSTPANNSAPPNTVYTFGRHRIDTSLPDGYPAPTPPGAIDLKRYPSVRRAEVTRSDDPDGMIFGLFGGMNSAFWPLFRHIQSREIPMTSPVEMDLPVPSAATASRAKSWKMAFLYRTSDLGPIGTADRGVIVRDADAVSVLALGISGQIEIGDTEPALASLRSWLDASGAWVEAGPARALYYNDPFTNPKWSEVQLPVRPRGVNEPSKAPR